MDTLNDIFSTFKLSSTDIERLSNETKAGANRSGNRDVNIDDLQDEVKNARWDLFDDISDKVWDSAMPGLKKITLGFQLFEIFPSYYHFLVPFYRGIRDKGFIHQHEKDIIWQHFMRYLASEKYYADPVAYVLWVEFFEDWQTVEETWQGLINNYTEKISLLRLLEAAGPVPFELKQPLYESLLTDEESHETIFKSLLFSAYDVFGKIDKTKALNLLPKLKVDTKTESYKLLMEKLK